MTHDDETIEAGVRRITGEQIDKAINELNDDNLERHEALHQVRKRCKKIRGLVRLARTSFERTYQFENAWFRDTASQFSAVRDTEA